MLRLELLPDRLTPATINGTAGADTFVLYTSGPASATLLRYDAGGALADSRTLTDATAIDAGGGNDTLLVAGAVQLPITFVGGGGTDSIRQSDAASFAVAGNFYSAAVGSTVSFDASTERLSASGTTTGNLFQVKAAPAVTAIDLRGGGGADVVLFGDLPSADITDDGANITVRRWDGLAPVSFESATFTSAGITGTATADAYRVRLVSAPTAILIDPAGGTDSTTVSGPTALTVTPAGMWDVFAAAGVGGVAVIDGTADQVTLADASSISVNGGGLPGTYLFASGTGPTQLTVNDVRTSSLANAGGVGWLSVAGTRGLLFPDAANYSLTLNGTGGNDTFLSTGPMTAATLRVDGGGGADTLWVQNATAATYGTAGGVGTVQRTGAAALRFAEVEMEGVNLTGTSGDDTLTVSPGVTRGVSLNGFGGNDTLTGGSGFDTITGGDGDDNLYGGAGNDTLSGEAGNDGLFGGSGTNTLTGGLGADRFLLWSAGVNTVADAESGDAQIRFTPGTAANAQGNAVAAEWRDDEIVSLDTALGSLHRYTGNTKLLKTAAGVSMGFEKWGETLVNGQAVLGWNFGEGVVSFTTTQFGFPALSVWASVYHEFAHNWDTPAENASVTSFRTLSGWTTTAPASLNGWGTSDPAFSYGQTWYYLQSAGFARNYGSVGGPTEDYATTWETALSVRFHGTAPTFEGGAPNTLVAAKAANVWAFIDGLRS